MRYKRLPVARPRDLTALEFSVLIVVDDGIDDREPKSYEEIFARILSLGHARDWGKMKNHLYQNTKDALSNLIAGGLIAEVEENA